MVYDEVKTQGYSVTIDAQVETHRGVYWRGTLLHQARIIGTVENRGDGGQTRVTCTHRTDRVNYETAATIACPNSGEPDARFAELLADVADGAARAV